MTDQIDVLVYGTLKRGMRNHQHMEGWQYLGDAVTAKPDYVMREFASISKPGKFSPGIFEVGPSESGAFIAGEVFRGDANLSCLLDEFEGVAIGDFKVGNYRRDTNILLEDGRVVSMYIKIGAEQPVTRPQFVHYDHAQNTYQWIEKNAY